MLLRQSNYVRPSVPHCNMTETGGKVSQPTAKISVPRSCIEIHLFCVLFYLVNELLNLFIYSFHSVT
jgi:hypothetical protein